MRIEPAHTTQVITLSDGRTVETRMGDTCIEAYHSELGYLPLPLHRSASIADVRAYFESGNVKGILLKGMTA